MYDPILTALEAAQRLGLTRKQFYKLVERGKIHRDPTEPHVNVYRASEIARYKEFKKAHPSARTYRTRTLTCNACRTTFEQKKAGRPATHCPDCQPAPRKDA